jgi:hypothetical protein
MQSKAFSVLPGNRGKAFILTYAKIDRLTAAPRRNAEGFQTPFRHFLVAPVLDAGVAAHLLDQLEDLKWRRNLGARFCFDVPEPSSDYLAFHDSIVSSSKFEVLSDALFATYRLRDMQLFNIDLHKYGPGAGIGTHTDQGVDEFRFVLNLNRNWELSHGGVWILSSSSDLSKQTRYAAPIHNSGFGFRPGVNTFHALSERFAGTSYAIVFRFSDDDIEVL